jgi:hypothetical protein
MAAADDIRKYGEGFGRVGRTLVVRIGGKDLAPTAPTTGQALLFNGAQWAPGGLGATAIAGDVTGTLAAATVAKLQGRAVDGAAPFAGDALVWNGAQWAPALVDAVRLQGQGIAVVSPTEGQALAFNGTQWAPSRAGLLRLTTTNATPAAIGSIPIPPQCAAGLHMTISAVKAGGGELFSIQYAFGVKADGATASLIDTPDPIKSDGAIAGTSLNLNFSGLTLQPEATGVAATTIYWVVQWELRGLAQYP